MPAMPAMVTPMPAWAMRRPRRRAAGRAAGARLSRERDAEQPDALDDRRSCRGSARRRGRRRAPAAPCVPSAATSPTARGDQRGPPEPQQRRPRSARFQGSTGPIAIAANTGMASGNTVALKNGAPTLIFCAEQQVGEQRIHRAGEHHGADRAQQDVVQHQRALARDRREQAAGDEPRRAEREQQQRAADHQRRAGRG